MSYTSAQTKKPLNVKGITLTIGIHVLVVAGVVAMPGIELPEKSFSVILGKNIPLNPPEPPLPPEVIPEVPEVQIASASTVTTPKTKVVALPRRRDITPTPFTSTGGDLAVGGIGIGDRIPIDPIDEIVKPTNPVITSAALNARYAGQFQPSYPTAMVRMEQEGLVSVRVLVGTDGRAKKIELISSPHHDFWETTRKHALRKWRFSPATRDGKPYEAWISLKVKFELKA